MLGELRKKSESQMGCKPTTKKSAHFGKIGKKKPGEPTAGAH